MGRREQGLYYFECRSDGIDLAKVKSAFATAKTREAHRRAYPRLNAEGTCLYVGSSQSLAKRLRDHLGFGAPGTYALQLVHWATPLSLQLDFVCAKYGQDAPPDVVQALEDTLWEVSDVRTPRRQVKAFPFSRARTAAAAEGASATEYETVDENLRRVRVAGNLPRREMQSNSQG